MIDLFQQLSTASFLTLGGGIVYWSAWLLAFIYYRNWEYLLDLIEHRLPPYIIWLLFLPVAGLYLISFSFVWLAPIPFIFGISELLGFWE